MGFIHLDKILGVGVFSNFCKQTISVAKSANISRCNDDLESCAVKFNYNSLSFIIIIGIYRLPSGNMHNFTLNKINLHKNTVFITGYINLNFIAIKIVNVLNFTSALHSLHFISVINKPTRFPTSNSDSTPTISDLI